MQTTGGFGQSKAVVMCLQREPELSRDTVSLLEEPLRKVTWTLASLKKLGEWESSEIWELATEVITDAYKAYCTPSLIGIVQGVFSEESFKSVSFPGGGGIGGRYLLGSQCCFPRLWARNES